MLFALPVFLIAAIVWSFIFSAFGHDPSFILLVTVAVGSLKLLKDTYRALIAKRFALDYIAILAITFGLLTHDYLVAAIITLMLSGGNALEQYGIQKAKSALTLLKNRIPHSVILADSQTKLSLNDVQIGDHILIRSGEVIPLDGKLVSGVASIDEQSLTGESTMVEKSKGDLLLSGTVNVGQAIVVTVSAKEKDSTYSKLIEMVALAQAQKSPLIRLADRYSIVFTILTLAICALAYVITGDLSRVLAVLVLATPCPLILATPIALMGGVSAAARKRIIVKKLASLEVLARARALIFDKTGTLTLGKPRLTHVVSLQKKYSQAEILKIAYTLETQSLHPYAKAICAEAIREQIHAYTLTHAKETLGVGVRGDIAHSTYSLVRSADTTVARVDLFRGDICIGYCVFQDQVKTDAVATLKALAQTGLHLALYTGDSAAHTQQVFHKLSLTIETHTQSSPKEKLVGIRAAQKKYGATIMIGDGINDAPALAAADCGIVFTNSQQTAASQAADIVLLHGDLAQVSDMLAIATRTIRIAKQGIFVGIGLSAIGMVGAALGYIAPLTGAFAQEAIDVLVILAALRASR